MRERAKVNQDVRIQEELRVTHTHYRDGEDEGEHDGPEGNRSKTDEPASHSQEGRGSKRKHEDEPAPEGMQTDAAGDAAMYTGIIMEVVDVIENKGPGAYDWFGSDATSLTSIKWNTKQEHAMEQLLRYGRHVEFHVHDTSSPEFVDVLAREWSMIPGVPLDSMTNDRDAGKP